MREVLSKMISDSAVNDESFLLLTGDHGYALFDEIRKNASNQFVNVGIMEQALISMASGLSKVGFKPLCYGLSAFVPIRVLEQIKFDICLPQLPVKMIGDGAGLIYTNLGNSHHCAEDIAALRVLPDIEIYSPGDAEEMKVCYQEFISSDKPAYLRIGKADNPIFNHSPLENISPYYPNEGSRKDICFVSTGPMGGVVHSFAKEFDISHVSIMKIKPLNEEVVEMLSTYKELYIFEEHARNGGLTSAITDLFVDMRGNLPLIQVFSLNSSFIKNAGTYQYALSEHGLSNEQIHARLKGLL